MRIIDWSSDVCASDLPCGGFGVGSGHAPPSSIPCRAHLCYNSVGARHGIVVHEVENAHERAMERCVNLTALLAGMQHNLADERADVGRSIEPRPRVFQRRSEERRVGKEWVSPCWSGRTPHPYNKPAQYILISRSSCLDTYKYIVSPIRPSTGESL